MTAALHHYRARMQRVLDHIDAHLNGELDLDTVSAIAAFSKFHFHRQFTATFEVSVHRYVQLARLKRASARLASGGVQSVTEIAMDAGYESPDAFARAFRRRFGQSPSAFRKSPDWAPWLAAFGPFETARSKLMDTNYTEADVAIREEAPIAVAVLAHRGDRARLPETIETFIRWRRAAGLSPETSPTVNIFRSERTPANPADYSMDLCVGTDMPIAGDDPVMKPGMIPGGRCAVLRVNGASNNLEPAALYLYGDWLPASGEEARDFPIYCRRYIDFRPAAASHDVVAELFLPLK